MKALHFALIVAVATACGHKPDRVAPDSRPPEKVQIATVELTTTPTIVEVVGTVRAKRSATIAAKITASVREVGVQAGATVTAGQLLAKLDDRALRAEYDRAKTDSERYQALEKKAAATPAEAQAVQMRYQVAEAALSDCQLAAPFAGLVVSKTCDVGDLATPGKPLFILEQPTDFRLEVNVPEHAAVRLATGQAVDCAIEATGEICAGRVEEVLPAADPVTRTVLTKIALKCRLPLKSGMFGRAQLPSGERRTLVVPQSAVHERGQLTYIFIADAGTAHLRLVKTGQTLLNAVEILAGLQAGERVIVGGTVADGQPVTP